MVPPTAEMQERARPGVIGGRLRTWQNQSRGRKFVAIAVVASAASMATAFATPAAREVITSVLGAVGRALGVTSSPSLSGLAPSPGTEQGSRVTPGPGASQEPPPAGTIHSGNPRSPTALTAVAASSSEIDLSWTDVSTETGYRVERSTDGTSWTAVATTGRDVTTYRDKGLNPTTTYYYRVIATNAGGDSPASDVGSATTQTDPPETPTGLIALPASSSEIDLSWIDVSTETGYRVERSPDGSTGWAAVASTGQDITTYSDKGLAPTSTYYYRVYATNAGGDSLTSSVGSATTQTDQPGPPTALIAVAASSSEIDLTWTDVSSETGYRVERSTDGMSWNAVATTGQDITAYSDTGLSATTTYYYRVFATNAGGDSPASDVVSATTQTAAPSRPSSLTALAASSSEIDVTWSGVASATGYRVERSTDGSSGWVTVATTGPSVTTYRDTGLSPTTTYYYRVFATNAGGDSPASDVQSASTGA
jgi:fibronectin type 3 domain-containing protein